MKKTYTKEEKQAYFKGLRERWTANKASADQDEDTRKRYEAIKAEAPDFKISYYSFYFTLQSMKMQGFDGLPYVDAKTFNGWQGAGFIVKKVEKATLEGITWLEVEKDKKQGQDEAESFLMPKSYKLFHRSQVEAITA